MGEWNSGNRISAGLVTLAAVLLLIPICSLSAEIPGFSEELSPNPVGRDGRFTLTIILDRDTTEGVSLELPDLPPGVRLYRGPSIAPIWEQLENGAYVRKVRINTTFTAVAAGKTILGGFLLRVEDEETLTGHHLVRAGLWQNRSLVIPYEPQWVVPDKPVYTGQAVPVVLTVRNMEEVTLFDRVVVDQPSGAMFERIRGIGTIESRTVGDITLYDIPVAGFMLTPSGSGSVVLPEAVVGTEEVTGRADSLRLEVLSLPEDVKSTGAVGSFTYSAALQEGETLEGRELELNLRLAGTGNLNYLEIPDPAVEGLTLVSKNDLGNFQPGAAGYSGSREITYLYLPEGPGQAVIKTADIRVLNPETGRVGTLRGRIFTLSVAAAPAAAAEVAGPTVFPFEPVHTGRSRIFSGAGLSFHPWWYTALLPGPLLFLLILVIRKIPRGTFLALLLILSGCAYEPNLLEELSPAAEACEAGRYDEAAEVYRRVLRQYPDEAVEVYNYAICSYHSGEIMEALQAARHAVYQAPLFFRARNMLKWIEEEHDLPGGVTPLPPYHPDIFFLLLVVSINGSALFALFRLFRKRGMYMILLILCLFLSIPAGIALWYSSAERNRPSGIVYREDIHLLKIPSESAAPWVALQPGTAVQVLQKAGTYILVRSGKGVEGWIPEDSLIRDSQLPFLLDDRRVIE